jgi:hypothetical protein
MHLEWFGDMDINDEDSSGSSSSSSNHLLFTYTHTDLSKQELDCCLIRLLEEESKQKN